MINPRFVVKALGEKKNFFGNHPTFYALIKDSLGEGLPEGTVIEIEVTKPDGKKFNETIEIQKSDASFFNAVKELFG